MSRRLLSVVALSLPIVLSAATAQAAPPWWEGYGQYRIVDASGKVAQRGAGGPGDRVVMRPSGPLPFLLRSRPYYLSGYAGATYDTCAPPRPAPRQARVPYSGLGLFGGH